MTTISENFKNIPNYETSYMISDNGIVVSKSTFTAGGNGFSTWSQDVPMKPKPTITA